MLSDEVEEKSVLVCALESTGQNIQTEMELKGVGSQPIVAQVADVRSRWEELRKNIETHSKDVGISAEKFHRFITRLTVCELVGRVSRASLRRGLHTSPSEGV